MALAGAREPVFSGNAVSTAATVASTSLCSTSYLSPLTQGDFFGSHPLSPVGAFPGTLDNDRQGFTDDFNQQRKEDEKNRSQKPARI